jgi:hypothetical protein
MLSTLFLPAATFVSRNKFQALCLVVLFVAVQRLAIDFVFAQTMPKELVMPGAKGQMAPSAVAVLSAPAASAHLSHNPFGEQPVTTQVVYGNIRPEVAATSAETCTNASTKGCFGPVAASAVIPIHSEVLPDGRVWMFGSNTNGAQGSITSGSNPQTIFAFYDPNAGTYELQQNPSGVDTFCSGHGILQNGYLFTVSGDLTINGIRNYSNNSICITNPSTYEMSCTGGIDPRWYTTAVSLLDGRKIVIGGINHTPTSITPTASIQISNIDGTIWQTLGTDGTPIVQDGGSTSWYYPRSFAMNFKGKPVVIVVGYSGAIFGVDPANSGAVTQIGLTFRANETLPVVQFAPGKLFSLRYVSGKITGILIDFSNLTGALNGPLTAITSFSDQNRIWSNLTLLADGKVLIVGGSSVNNDSTSTIAYTPAVWDSTTNMVTLMASGQIQRLYHSTSILLPDGSVLIGGGGAPGTIELNTETFYPPYLYNSDGSLATRPSLTNVTSSVSRIGQVTGMIDGSTTTVTRVTAVRIGAITHSSNPDQMFFDSFRNDLSFSLTGNQLTVNLPQDPTILIPGNYMLYVWDQNGHPSVASIVHIAAANE